MDVSFYSYLLPIAVALMSLGVAIIVGVFIWASKTQAKATSARQLAEVNGAAKRPGTHDDEIWATYPSTDDEDIVYVQVKDEDTRPQRHTPLEITM